MGLRFWTILLTCSMWASPLFAESAEKLLERTAETYAHLSTFQVEAVAERRIEGELLDQKATIALYTALPDKIRIELRDNRAQPQVVILTNGRDTAEFHPRSKDYYPISGAEMSVRFSPERGVGMGEMLYDTIADGVVKSKIRGKQTLKIGSDKHKCAVVDVEYATDAGKSQFSFWIALDTALVLRRAVTFVDDDGMVKTLVSTIQALTLNDQLEDSVFEVSRTRPETTL